MTQTHIPDREIAERPTGYQGPNLSPTGLALNPVELADEVHALMATIPPKDNNGLIVGTEAALVVDAGVTPTVAAMIQSTAAHLTTKPIRYLVNTTYHGDHTFGNMGFPAQTVIVSSRINKENMTDLGYEKQVRSGNMYGDEKLFDAVTRWRTPDIVFDDHAEIDLGGRTVQLWQFGPGNGPGDTVVYVPDARAAWTGNFLCHAGTAHMLLQGGPLPYLDSLRRMRQTLPELRTIVPGHGPMGDGPAAIDTLIDYFETLHAEVTDAADRGLSLAETEEFCTDPWSAGLDPALAAALAAYAGPAETIQARFLELCRNLHRLNVMATYRLYAPAE
ncbi:MBL fold metallo-hydrolase [Nocardia sp. NPDC101769]|uniref:MBL fold metallo-hydrolase n=1 Tax=Nocardia sp. NPDC101769 TaxID=3364333 RepID=UPI003821BF85